MQYFQTNLPYQNPLLRQLEYEVKNGLNTKSGAMPFTTLFSQKFNLSMRKNLINSSLNVLIT